MVELYHESVIPNLRNGVRFYYSDEPLPKYVPFHWHNSIELVYVIDGHLRFTIDGRPLHVHDGEFAMVGSGAIHDVASGPNHAYVLQVPLRAIRPFRDNPEDASFVNGRTGTLEYAEVATCVATMGKLIERPAPGASFDFEISLLSILKCMYGAFAVPRSGSNATEGVKEIIAYLHEHATEQVRVDELAARFGYNPSYLSRMFKQQTGISIVSYLYEVRVNLLYDDLLNTDASIGELMRKNGLTNVRLAREAFKQQFGMLPSDVRQGTA